MNSPINKLADGRYTVGQMIGTGGMADVYQGLDTRLNREVAIKVLRRDLAKDPAFVARFKKEALVRNHCIFRDGFSVSCGETICHGVTPVCR